MTSLAHMNVLFECAIMFYIVIKILSFLVNLGGNQCGFQGSVLFKYPSPHKMYVPFTS